MAIKQLAQDLHIIRGLVNVYVLETADGLAVLDTGFPSSTPKILDGARARSSTQRRPPHPAEPRSSRPHRQRRCPQMRDRRNGLGAPRRRTHHRGWDGLPPRCSLSGAA